MCQQGKLIERTPGQFVCYHWVHPTFAYAGDKKFLNEKGIQCNNSPDAVICCHPSCPSHYQKLFDSDLISKEFYHYYSPNSTVPEPCCDEIVKEILTIMTSMQEVLTQSYLEEHQAPEKDEDVREALLSTYRIAEHHGIKPDPDSVLDNFLKGGV